MILVHFFEALLFSTLDYAPALIFAALGCVMSERSGVIDVGVEGKMRVGAFVAAVAALGVSVARLRWSCVLVSGLFAGLGGAALSTATLDRFEQHMPAGLGFMALAAMVFGRWTPLGAFGAALFFAGGSALRIGLASS